MKDTETSIKSLKTLVEKFCKERSWHKHHTPKNLAISIALEAAELLEHFQWDEYRKNNKSEIEAELADVMIYLLHFADSSNIDISSVVEKKVKKSSQKYPAHLFKSDNGSKKYFSVKARYRAKRK